MKQDLPNFDSNPLTCDASLFPGPNIVKSNHIFPGKGRGDKDFILTYLAEVFPHYCLLISISTIFSGNRGLKLEPKVLTLVPYLLQKNSNPSKNFQAMFLFARVLQSWTKHLRQTSFHVTQHNAGKFLFLFYFSAVFCQYQQNFFFWEEDQSLGYNSMKF